MITPHSFAKVLRRTVVSAVVILCGIAQAGQLWAQTQEITKTRIWPKIGVPLTPLNDTLVLHWNALGYGCMSYGTVTTMDLGFDLQDLSASASMDLKVVMKVTAKLNSDLCNYSSGADADSVFTLTYSIGRRIHGVAQAPSISPDVNLSRALDGQDHQTFSCRRARSLTFQLLSVQRNLGSGWVGLTVLPAGVQFDAQLQWSFIPTLDYHAPHFVSPTVLDCNNGNGHPDELLVAWSSAQGAYAYDLEWTWVDDYPGTGTTVVPTSHLNYDLLHDATRVSVSEPDTRYRIPLLFDRGHLVMRVRAVGHDPTTGLVVYGDWSLSNSTGTVATAHTSNAFNTYAVSTAHEPKLNWQLTSTFAEEGKHKEVMTYADGTLRSREVVTRNNSLDVPIIGETFYDAVGRAAVESMPVPLVRDKGCPTLDNNHVWAPIELYTGFNKASGPTEYTYKKMVLTGDDCGASSTPFDPADGAELYYNPAHMGVVNALTGRPSFLPLANGYPFTQTEFTRDNTGRVRKKSGVGDAFKLGSGHESEFLYGKPEQIKLDRLFGSEAGYAAHYQKNVVVDGNGQASVSYVDHAGHTVATALAGGAPSGMDAITPYPTPQDAPSYVTDMFGGQSNLECEQNVLDPTVPALVFTDQFTVSANDLAYSFAYTLATPVVTSSCLDVCLTCVYDLSIQVVDQCGAVVLHSEYPKIGNFQQVTGGDTTLLFAACGEPGQMQSQPIAPLGPVTLDIGEYTLIKTLQVHAEARDAYVAGILADGEHLLSPACFTPLDDLEEQYQAAVNTADCYIDCADCYAALGSVDDFVLGGHGTAAEYEMLRQQCDDLCKEDSWCTVAYQTMLADMTLDGQYATVDYDDNGDLIVPDRASVFYFQVPVNGLNSALSQRGSRWNPETLSYEYDGTSDDFPVQFDKPLWQQPMFRMEDGTYVHEYLDNYGERTTVVVSLVDGTYEPALVNTEDPWVFTNNDGLLVTYPENLADLADFLAVLQPGFERSLVFYHPEYCYWLDCKGYSVKSAPSDPMTSDEFDNWLRGLSFTAASMQTGTNPPDLIHASATNPLDQIRIFVHTGMGAPLAYDPFGVNDAAYAPYASDLRNKFVNYLTYDGGVHYYSMAQAAAIFTRCGPYPNQAPTNPHCSAFGQFGSEYTIGTETPTDVYNAEWETFKGLFFSEKYRLQKQLADEKAASCGCGGINYCIGQHNDNDWRARLDQPRPNELALPSWFNDAVPNPLAQYEILAVRASRSRLTQRACQACSDFTSFYYTNKAPRFPEPAQFPGMNTSPVDMAYQNYAATGDCPLASAWLALFSELANGHHLDDAVNLATTTAWSGVMVAQNGTAAAIPGGAWAVTSATSSSLVVTVTPTGGPTCAITLANAGAIPDPWNSIFAAVAIDAHPGGTFDLHVNYFDVAGVAQAGVLNGTICSTYDLVTCSFPMVGTSNELGDALQQLMSLLATSPTTADVLSSSTPVNLNTPLWAAPAGAPSYQSQAPSYFANQFGTSASWIWNWDSGTQTFHLSTTAGTYPRYSIQVLGVIDPQAGFTLATGLPSIYSFENLHSTGSNLFDVDVYGDGPGFTLLATLHCSIIFQTDATLSQELPAGTYGYPPSAACAGFMPSSEYDMTQDLYNLAVDFFHSFVEGGYFNFFSDPFMTDQLRAVLAPLQCQNWVAPDGPCSALPSAGPSPYYDTYRMWHFGDGYCFTINLLQNNPAPNQAFSSPVPYGDPDENGFYHAMAFYQLSSTGEFLYPDSPIIIRVDCFDLAFCCSTPPCDPLVMPPPTPVVPAPDDGCVDMLMTNALNNAHHAYQDQVDQLTLDLTNAYNDQCMHALETLAMTYQDPEYHYTLYYYDQAGNLVKTIPPEGVEPLDIGSVPVSPTEQATIDAISADRENGTHNVLTGHRMPSEYVFNSLNSPIRQNMPDMDRMDIWDVGLTTGLSDSLRITSSVFQEGGRGYLCGWRLAPLPIQSTTRGYVYTTNNGGATWARSYGLVAADLANATFFNSTTGYAVGRSGTLLKTIDGGNSWDLMPAAANLGKDFLDVAFSSATSGVAIATGNGYAWLTTNGGTGGAGLGTANFGQLTSIKRFGTNYWVSAYTPDHRNGMLGYGTSNTFTQLTSLGATSTIMNTVCSYTATEGFAAGNTGVLMRTVDTGASWSTIKTGTTDNFKVVRFMDALNGLALVQPPGGNTGLRHTSDGGLTWVPIGDPAWDLRDLYMYAATNPAGMIAVGTNGTVVRLALSSAGTVATIPMPSITGQTLTSVWAITIGTSPNTTLLTLCGTADGMLYWTSDLTDPDFTAWVGPLSPTIFTGNADVVGIAAKVSGNNVNVLFCSDGGQLNAAVLNTSTGGWSILSQGGSLNKAMAAVSGGAAVYRSATHAVVDLYNLNTLNSTSYPYYTQTLTYPTNGPTTSVSMRALTVMNGTSTAIAVGTSGATGAVYSLKMITSPAWTDRSWSVRPLPILDMAEDDQVAVGVQGTVLYPTGYNSTNQWIAVPTSTLADLHGVANLGSHLLIAVGDDGTAFTMTPNVPGSFSSITLPSAPDLNDVVVKSGAVTIAADGGTIFYSTTAHGIYTSTTSGGNINGLALNPGGEVFAVGDKALVNRMFGSLRANVTEVFTPRLNDISMADVMDGYVAGNNLVVRHTVDGGQSWNLVPVPSTEIISRAFNAVAVHGPGHALAVGTNSLLATITGDAYSPGTIPTTITAQDIATSASGATVVVGFNGTTGVIAKRTPSGVWIYQTITSTPLYALWSWPLYGLTEDFLAAGHLGKQYLCKYNPNSPTLFPTTNLPTTIPPSGATADILGLFFHDRIAGYAVGTGGKIYRTLQSNPLDHSTLTWVTPPPVLDNGASLLSQNGALITARTIGFSDRHHGFIGGDYNTGKANYARTIHDESQLYSNRFWYDELGRLILSQNTKQFNYADKQYSYSLYDNLGRVVEAGVINDHPKTFHTILGMDVNGQFDPDRIAYANFQNWIGSSALRYEVVRTYYDKPMTVVVGVSSVPVAGLSAVFSTGSQDNLRLRVADVTYAAQFHSDRTYEQASHYSYDIHGNVKELVQDDKTMSTDVGSDQQFKDLRYSYDLISGNVRQVDYQTGKPDQFHHRYTYDADNRIDHVETSRSGVLWREDARYFYYPQGPLERVELGDKKVQGLDYAYTLQGWLKSINSDLLLSKNDMGQDALKGTVNELVGRDVYGLSLGYYSKGSTTDYAPIDNTRWSTIANRPIAASIPAILSGNWYSLYNGNIASTVNSLAPFGGYHTQVDELGQALAMAYRYDQLNRLDKAVGQIGLTASNDWKNAVDPVSLRYQSTYGYDANGNILNTQRWDQFGVRYDNMVYAYQTQTSELLRNRLYNVKETADPSNTIVNQTADGFEDYPYQPTAAVHLSDGTPNANTDNNYGYDAIGDLVRDNINGIQDVQWSASGKVQIVKRTGAVTEIDFDYGPTGERRIKRVNHSGGTYTKDYYVHDAQGNIMAVYHYDPLAASLKVTDHPIYGRKRLGVDRFGLELLGNPSYDPLGDPLGQVNYELTDHLGNVATSVTDELIPTQTANKDPYFQPNLVTAQGYEPFGGLLPGRNYNSSNYRFGFQGQEKDDEVYGTTGASYAFEYRMHDSRVGRFWSIDPLARKYSYFSPFTFSGNRLIDSWEIEGLEPNPMNYMCVGFQEYFRAIGHDIDQLGGTVSGWFAVTTSKITGDNANISSTTKSEVTAGTNFENFFTPPSDNRTVAPLFIINFTQTTTVDVAVDKTVPTPVGEVKVSNTTTQDQSTGKLQNATEVTYGVPGVGVYASATVDDQGTTKVEAGAKAEVETPSIWGTSFTVGAKVSVSH